MDVGKRTLTLIFESIVQLLAKASPNHLEHAFAVEASRPADRHHLLKNRRIGQVAFQRSDDSRMLNLDRNFLRR